MPAPIPTPPGRNPWPLGIVAAFALFIAGTAGLIVLASFHNQDLVTPDYYEQELRHQQAMDSRDRARALEGLAAVTHDPATGFIDITLPPEHAATRPKGEVHLYRPAAASEDRRLPLALDARGHQLVNARELSPGPWRVRVTWTHEEQQFALEQKVILGGRKSPP
jgi:hypothetical protein